MVTQVEEQQARDFLKRAEIRTMRKDLQALRESDALKERDKIAHIRTLEEQLSEQQAKQEKERAKMQSEKSERQEVLEKNAQQERVAEKDLKSYATEEERQQIFLFESERLNLQKQADLIDNQKDPELKLQKNNLLLQVRDWQTKLDSVLAEEKKLEDQQIFIAQKGQTATIPEERKGLEQSRADLEEKIQDEEKKRWKVEKEIEAINNKIVQIDRASRDLVTEKNILRDKILGIDKSLRDIYSTVIEREEAKKRGELQEQRQKTEAVSKAKEERFENVRRQQWTPQMVPRKAGLNVPDSGAKAKIGEKLAQSFQKEEEQRKSFIKFIEEAEAAEKGEQKEVLPPPLPPAPKKQQ